jgi:hypothetical protein
VRQARRDAGANPDTAMAAKALAQAAADQGVTLTPHHVAMTRAGDAANRIEQHMDFPRRTGKLREFTRMYKQRRTAAAAQGQGFLTYPVAELRLRRANPVTCRRQHHSDAIIVRDDLRMLNQSWLRMFSRSS